MRPAVQPWSAADRLQAAVAPSHATSKRALHEHVSLPSTRSRVKSVRRGSPQRNDSKETTIPGHMLATTVLNPGADVGESVPSFPLVSSEYSIAQLLVNCRLENYEDVLVDAGWDDVQYLVSLTPDQLMDVANSVGMKPGHAQKFVHYLSRLKARVLPSSVHDVEGMSGGGLPAASPASASSSSGAATWSLEAHGSVYHYEYVTQTAAPEASTPYRGVDVALPQTTSPYKRKVAGSSSGAAAERSAAKAQRKVAGKRKVAGSSSGAAAERSAAKAQRKVAGSSSGAAAERSAAKAQRMAAKAEVRAIKAEARARAKAGAKAEAEARAARRMVAQAEKAAGAKAEAEARAARRMVAQAEKAYAAARPVSADGHVRIEEDGGAGGGADADVAGAGGAAASVGLLAHAVGRTVWLSLDADVRELWGRLDWTLADHQVHIVRVDAAAGTFDGHAVPPGRRAVHGLPLAHITHASVEEREIRNAEHRARRERLSREAAQALAELQAAAEEGGGGVDPSLAGHTEAKRRRLIRQMSVLALPEVPVRAPSEDAGGGAGGAGGTGGGRLIHYRPPARELPADLATDAEAVAVFHAAILMKRLRVAADQWVCGWRMRTVTRHTGGAADLYIRSPDMNPATMQNKHDAVRTTPTLTLAHAAACRASYRRSLASPDPTPPPPPAPPHIPPAACTHRPRPSPPPFAPKVAAERVPFDCRLIQRRAPIRYARWLRSSRCCASGATSGSPAVAPPVVPPPPAPSLSCAPPYSLRHPRSLCASSSRHARSCNRRRALA